jgi:hypothetical protein
LPEGALEREVPRGNVLQLDQRGGTIIPTNERTNTKTHKHTHTHTHTQVNLVFGSSGLAEEEPEQEDLAAVASASRENFKEKVPDFTWSSGGPTRNSMWMMRSPSDEVGVKFHLFEAMNECTEASVRSLKIVDRGAAEKAKKDTFWAVCYYRSCSIKDDGNGKKEVVEDSPDSASVAGKFKSDQTMTVLKRDLRWKKVPKLTTAGSGLLKFTVNSKKNALDWVRTWAETTQDASSEEDADSGASDMEDPDQEDMDSEEGLFIDDDPDNEDTDAEDDSDNEDD